MGKHGKHDKRVRTLIAQEAARIMYEQSIQDYRAAKNKACTRLGFGLDVALPSNAEIQQALQEYIRLFKAQEQERLCGNFYDSARQAMSFLGQYNPRLVGAVVNGTANENSAVHLHVFADTVEEVILFLTDQGIAFEIHDVLAHFGEGQERKVAKLNFIAGDMPIEITIFPIDGIRRAPNSPVDGKPMKRLTVSELEKIKLS